MYFRGITVVCLAVLQYFLCNSEMDTTGDQIRQFLQLEADSQFEFLDIEFPDRLHKRAFSGPTMPAGRRMRIRTPDKNITLWLFPVNPILVTNGTPVYFSRGAVGKPGNVSIERQDGLMNKVGEALTDPVHLASLVIGRGYRGIPTVNGVIGSMNLVVRSLPESIIDDMRKRRSISNFSNSMHHVVYTSNGTFEEKYSLGAFNETTLPEGQRPPEVPKNLYPKILAIFDYSVYNKQGQNMIAFLEYIIAFWNSVNLKYRVFVSPQVKLHIAGILIALDATGLPYISDHMRGDDAFSADTAIQYARNFFHNIKDSIPLESYDIAHTTTRLTFGVGYAAMAVGKALPGTVCNNIPYPGTMSAVAFSKDNGAFWGVPTTAHELGHVFGVDHDLEQSSDCLWTNGFIMTAAVKYTSNSSSFSTCSLAEFQKMFDGGNYTCMYKKPSLPGEPLHELFPGKMTNLTEQCLIHDAGPPCVPSSERAPLFNICSGYYCMHKDNYCWETGYAALDGTLCSDPNEIVDRHCVHNQCVRVL